MSQDLKEVRKQDMRRAKRRESGRRYGMLKGLEAGLRLVDSRNSRGTEAVVLRGES